MIRSLMRAGRATPVGGLTTTPSYVGSGTGFNAVNNNNGPTYPTNASGDLFILRIYATAVTTPAGWTLQDSKQSPSSGIKLWVYTRDTRASGSDSGTLSIVCSGLPTIAQIDGFRNVSTTTPVESTATSSVGTGGTSLTMPTITPGGVHRYAYCAVASNGGNAGMAAATGATGGTWLELIAEQTSGLGDGLQAQGVALDAGGAISGGTMVINTAQAMAVALSLVGI